MKPNREDVVQAALILERWCDKHQDDFGNCDCPFAIDLGNRFGLCKIGHDRPMDWSLETFLRTRGLKEGGERE